MTTIYTTGVFDLLHPGHIETLKRASALGDRLVVGVQDDESVFEQKGQRPAMSCSERMTVLTSLPFVDDCFSYADIDQRPMLDKIKPDVMVQTEEWVGQTDRTDIISYLHDHDIRLVLLPIKKDISSTQIKNRVIQNAQIFRNDVTVLENSLKIMPARDLSVYERFDPKRTDALVAKIKQDGCFYNPITVAEYQGAHIVIDGANRLEALERLGVSDIFVQVVDYRDDTMVHLRHNVHYLDMPADQFVAGLTGKNISYTPSDKETAMRALQSGDADAVIVMDGSYVFCQRGKSDRVSYINAFVETYLGKSDIFRLSELGQDADTYPVKIIFRTFEKDDIYALSQTDAMLTSGVTWHEKKNSIIHFSIPIELLQKDMDIEKKNAWLQGEIQKKIQRKDIRYYPSNVFLCNEWE